MVCQRCGVIFDDSRYLPGAPCIDCQEYEPEPEYGWLNMREFAAQQKRDYYTKRNVLIAKYVNEGYSDKDIGRMIGMDDSTVNRARRNVLSMQQTSSVRMIDYDVVEFDRQSMIRRRKQ